MKRNIAIALVAAAFLVGGGAGWVATRVDHHTDKPALTAKRTPVSRPVRIVTYVTKARPNGLMIDSPSKVGQLTGTSIAFKQFVATQVQTMIDDHACDGSAHTVGVATYASNGYAIGSLGDCGGYAALWGVRNGLWKLLIGTQDSWSCAELHKYGVPKGLMVGAQCYVKGVNGLRVYTG